MLRNAGQTLPREVILNRVWGADSEVEDGNLDNYIHFLRRRLKSVRSTLNLKPSGELDIGWKIRESLEICLLQSIYPERDRKKIKHGGIS